MLRRAPALLPALSVGPSQRATHPVQGLLKGTREGLPADIRDKRRAMRDLSDDLNPMPISFTLEPRRHRGDVIIESAEPLQLLLDMIAKPRGIVVVKDRDMRPHQLAS